MASLFFGGSRKRNTKAARLRKKRAKVRKLERKAAQLAEEKSLDARLRALQKRV